MAAEAITASIARRRSLVLDRVAATTALAVALASGRAAVALLDPVVGRLVAGNQGLVRAWLLAKRVTVPTGSVRRRKKA